MLTFSLFDHKYLFLGKFGPKNQNCQFQLKFGTQTNLNMQNSMVVFTFSALDQKNPFWGNFVQKSKIACSMCIQIQKLIRICRIQWWCPFFLFQNRNTLFGLPFLGKFGLKNQNGQLELKIGTKTNTNMKNSVVMFIFSAFDRKYPFFLICSVTQYSLLKL